MKQILIDRDIHVVQISPQDYRSAVQGLPQNSQSSGGIGDQALSASLAAMVNHAGPPFKDRQQRPGAVPFDPAETERLTKQLAEATTMLELLVRNVQRGMQRDTTPLAEISSRCLGELERDQDQMLATSIQATDSDMISSRSLKLSILGMAVAIELRLDERAVESIGLCGLIHDWGLYKLPEKLRSNHTPFTDTDWGHYMRHPTMTMDMLENVHLISPAVRQAAFQVHELCDGSGYPRGLTKERIHVFARILGTVDAYLCFTERRRGRPALVPHDALGCLLHQVPQHRLDGDVVKALLRVVSLFPIGSLVRLCDDSVATVIRSDPANYASPIISTPWRLDGPHPNGLSATPQGVMDLKNSGLRIVAAIPSPGKEEMQMPKQLMCDIHWDGPEC